MPYIIFLGILSFVLLYFNLAPKKVDDKDITVADR